MRFDLSQSNEIILTAATSRDYIRTGPPIGLGYIASYLRENGHDVTILDPSPLGLGLDAVGALFEKYQPKIAGVYFTSGDRYEAFEMTDVIKKASPVSLVVVGGPHATFMPELILKRVPSIDVVGKGEGEQTMVELAEAVKRKRNFRKIKGITFRDGDKIITTPPRELIHDLDSLPFPAYDLFPPLDRYASQGIAGNRRSGIIMTSRGCKYRCEFCYAVVFWQRKMRFRSPKNVVDEVEYLVNEFEVEFIKFFDDLFTYDQDRARKICEEIRARKISTNFLILSRVDTISKALLRNLKAAGCEQIQYGVESGSQRLLRKVAKGITIETVERVLSWTKKIGIKTLVFLMIGLPGETVEDVEMTFDFIKRNHRNVDEIEAAVNTILPGSRYYEMAKSSGKITDEIWFEYRNSDKLLWKDAPPYLENFDRDELLQYKRLQYILTISWRRDWGKKFRAILGYLWHYKRKPGRYLALANYLRRYRF